MHVGMAIAGMAIVGTVIVASPVVVRAQAVKKRAITFRDLISMRRLSDPRFRRTANGSPTPLPLQI